MYGIPPSLNKKVVSLALVLALAASTQVEARRHRRTLLDTVAQAAEDSVADTLTKAPEDLEICFSPDENCDRKIVKFAASAQSSLDIAIYDINLGSLVTTIIKKSRQIPVRMVVDRKQARTGFSAVPKLIAAGVKIKYGTQKGSGIMHNKFVIVDGRMLETGSFNETSHASYYNNENQIYLANPKVVERFKRRFDYLWEKGKAASDF